MSKSRDLGGPAGKTVNPDDAVSIDGAAIASPVSASN